MMKTMRRMTKSILWIVIAAFVGTIVFAWGMQFTARKSKQGVIAVINGKDIPIQSFQMIYEQRLKDAEKGEAEVTEESTKKLRDQVWTEIVDQTLLSQEVEKRGIIITNKELYEFMKRFPPREIMGSEVFQTNGKFDYSKYLQALSDPRIPWGQVEGYVRGQLLIAKLQESIIGAVRINDEEVYEKYVYDTQRARVNYIFIPVEEFPPSGIEISPAEIEKYFNENKENFKMVERAVIKFVEFPRIPSRGDEDKARAQLQEIREEILKGEDFAEMAKEYSEDPNTKNKGGDLGWLKKGSLREPMEEVVFSLKPGEVSEPLRSEYSMHLIKVLEKRKTQGTEEVHASHIVLKIEPSENTLAEIKNRAEEFIRDAKKTGFDKTAEEEGIELKESGMFVKGSLIPNLGMSKEANLFAFENKAGKISAPIETDLFYYVVQVKERKPAGIPSLEEAEPFAKEALLAQKRYELAYDKGMKIFKEVQEGKDFNAAAKKYEEKVMDSGEFTRDSHIPAVGQQPEFIGTAFALDMNNPICSPIKLTNGTYLLQLLSKSAVNDSLFQVEKDSLALNLLRKKQSDFYTQWFENLRKEAKIEDFRDQYYRETF
jgi:parvulin-like peptidyl-prolyl isomerase